jgi:uncharacterized protein YdhG (YjbR/CyaY superfamily)
MPAKAKTIDAYLAAISPDRRALLEKLRKAIHRAVPAAEECISYGMPAFRVQGGIVGGFAATKNACSYYPFSGQTLAELADDVSSFARTKSALHFSAKQPLPPGLLRKLVAARLAEIERGRKALPGKAKARARASSSSTPRGKSGRKSTTVEHGRSGETWARGLPAGPCS